jgi:signal transduction histidine kinase
VNAADARRRTRRTRLLLAAILIPAAVVVFLVFRVVRQGNELAERRVAEERRDALDQLRRELTARLQAIRLEEVNRLIGESGTRLPIDSPIVFVATMPQDEMQLPWEDGRTSRVASAEFVRYLHEGKSLEFQRRDPKAAVARYRQAVEAARVPSERCDAQVSLGRAQRKGGNITAAAAIDRNTVQNCGDVLDTDGVPFAVYAAQRLFDIRVEEATAADYVVRRAGARRWRSPHEAYALQSLLRRLPDRAAADASRRLAEDLHNIQQVTALAQDLHDHGEKLQRAFRTAPGDLSWMGYGDEPWLVTMVSPTSFAAPVVMAVSSRRLVPGGAILRATTAAAAVPLGDGFVDLFVEWPAGRFAGPAPVPVVLYGAMLSAGLGAVLLVAYLLLRDVHRETETAEMRSNFVASVSHELKTPLTSIRAHAETMLMGRAGGTETTAEYLKTIVSESERLTRLVDSVLEFSRIEQGRKTYHMQPASLADIARSAAKTMEYPLSQLGFTLGVSSDGSQPVLSADPEALAQAILNLLSNAMKYSGQARRIEMRLGTRGGEAFVDVTDHGVGIRREDQSRIFERFHRVQSDETAGIAGAGLGLALARHVVEAHRGRILVASEPGRGSTFSVRLPLQLAERDANRSESKEAPGWRGATASDRA